MKKLYLFSWFFFFVFLSTTVLAQNEYVIQEDATLELLSRDTGSLIEITLLDLSEQCEASTCEAKFSVNGQQTSYLGVGESAMVSGEELTVTNLGGVVASFSLEGSYGFGQGSDNVDFSFTVGETLTYQRVSDQTTLELTLFEVENDAALFSANGERTPLLRSSSVYVTEDGHAFKLASVHPRETRIELEGVYALVPSESYAHDLFLSQTKTVVIGDFVYEMTLLSISDCEEKENIVLVDPATGSPVPAMPAGEQRTDLIQQETKYYDCAGARAKLSINGEQIDLNNGDSEMFFGAKFTLVQVDRGVTNDLLQRVIIDVRPSRNGKQTMPIEEPTPGMVVEDGSEFVTAELKCDGCQQEGVCIPYGVRKDQAFCGLQGLMDPQKSEGQECENNYECSSNLCIDSQCVAQGLFRNIMNWFVRLF